MEIVITIIGSVVLFVLVWLFSNIRSRKYLSTENNNKMNTEKNENIYTEF